MNNDYTVKLDISFSYNDIGATSIDEAVRGARIRALDQLEKAIATGQVKFQVLGAYEN